MKVRHNRKLYILEEGPCPMCILASPINKPGKLMCPRGNRFYLLCIQHKNGRTIGYYITHIYGVRLSKKITIL